MSWCGVVCEDTFWNNLGIIRMSYGDRGDEEESLMKRTLQNQVGKCFNTLNLASEGADQMVEDNIIK